MEGIGFFFAVFLRAFFEGVVYVFSLSVRERLVTLFRVGFFWNSGVRFLGISMVRETGGLG